MVEKWIFHKLNIAADEINKQLQARNHMAATNAVYNFWLYELCDVYIVSASHLARNGRSLMENIGSYEAYDGANCACGDSRFFSADSIPLLGLRLAASSPLHAVRH